MKLSWLNGLLAISLSLGISSVAFAENVNVPARPGNSHSASVGPRVANSARPADRSKVNNVNNNVKKNYNKPNPHANVNARYSPNKVNRSHKTVVSSHHYVTNVTPRLAPVVPVVPAPAPVVVVHEPAPLPPPAPVVVVHEPAPFPPPAPVIVHHPAPVPPPPPAPVVVHRPAPVPPPHHGPAHGPGGHHGPGHHGGHR